MQGQSVASRAPISGSERAGPTASVAPPGVGVFGCAVAGASGGGFPVQIGAQLQLFFQRICACNETNKASKHKK